jgi:ABC-type glycerol-3-phosphate transport system substrate-binding protein
MKNPFASMRPFQLIIIIVFVLLAFVGLYLFANFTGFGNQANKIGTVVIWGTLPAAAVNQEINVLSSNNKAFGKVSYVQQPEASFDSNLANAIASGQGPTMILINQEQLLDEMSKLNVIPFSSIPQRTFINTYLPESSLFLTSTGTYGIPFVLDPLVLYYNKQILASAGVAVPPTTWEAVTGLAPTLSHVNTDQSIAQSAVALGQYNNINNARGILSLLFLQAGSPITSNTASGVRSTLSQVSQTDSSGTTPAVSALNFYTQFADPSRTVYSWNASFTSDFNDFIAGNLALYLGYASEEPTLKASNPNLNFDMAQIPQPQTSSHATDYGLVYAFAIPKASGNPAGAYAVAESLTTKGYVQTAAQALSMAPAQNALLVASPSDSYAPVYYPEALVAQGWLSPAPSVTDSIFSAMISNITTGQYQARNALQVADQALNAALPSSQ